MEANPAAGPATAKTLTSTAASRARAFIVGEATGGGAMISRVTTGEHDPSADADEAFCYLTTTGRRSGQPHTIEIWFAVGRGVVYMMAGGGDRSDWVRNVMADPAVRLQIGEHDWARAGTHRRPRNRGGRIRAALVARQVRELARRPGLVGSHRTPVAVEILGPASDG